jgi:hypothetical protein
MKKKFKKLSLNTETLRSLDAGNLSDVHGAASGIDTNCTIPGSVCTRPCTVCTLCDTVCPCAI